MLVDSFVYNLHDAADLYINISSIIYLRVILELFFDLFFEILLF